MFAEGFAAPERGLLLAQLGSMKTKTCPQPVEMKGRADKADKTVLIVGGSGGMVSRYRDVVEQHGCSLRHCETRLRPAARHSMGRIALVVIMVTMVSHALREQMTRLAPEGASVIYLRSASVSALKAALDQWDG